MKFLLLKHYLIIFYILAHLNISLQLNLPADKRELETRKFNSSYTCGECLNEGYKSCIKSSSEHVKIEQYDATD